MAFLFTDISKKAADSPLFKKGRGRSDFKKRMWEIYQVLSPQNRLYWNSTREEKMVKEIAGYYLKWRKCLISQCMWSFADLMFLSVIKKPHINLIMMNCWSKHQFNLNVYVQSVITIFLKHWKMPFSRHCEPSGLNFSSRERLYNSQIHYSK